MDIIVARKLSGLQLQYGMDNGISFLPPPPLTPLPAILRSIGYRKPFYEPRLCDAEVEDVYSIADWPVSCVWNKDCTVRSLPPSPWRIAVDGHHLL